MYLHLHNIIIVIIIKTYNFITLVQSRIEGLMGIVSNKDA